VAAGALVATLIVAWVGVVVSGDGSGGSIPTAAAVATPVPDGRRAPGFDLPALSGEGRVSLAGSLGHLVVVNVWASWCGPCREEIGGLQAAWVTYRSRGVHFLGVDHLDGRAPAMEFVREFGVTYPIGYDPEGEVANRYGLAGLPTTLVIAPDGTIAYRLLGRVAPETLRGLLERLLTG